MRVHVQGLGPLTLTSDDFLSAGGEGTVYARDDVAYKVYSDPDTLDARRLDALRALHVPPAVLPERHLTDDAGRLVGFTMTLLSGWWPLGRLLSRHFLDQHHIDAQGVLDVVGALRDAVAATHAAGALVVDLNEANVLVSPDFTSVKLIDVGSWQLPGFPATAVLDTVRDRHRDTFSRDTDHFALAVLTFSLLVGIHPYRGRHPHLRTLDARMRSRCSALRAEVRLPPGLWPLAGIPDRWRAWLTDVLEGDHRGAAPAGPSRVPWVPVPAPPSSGELVRTRLVTGPPGALGGRAARPRVAAEPTLTWTRTDRGTWLEVRRAAVGVTIATPHGALPVPCDQWTSTAHRLLVLQGRQLVEVRPRELASGRVILPTRRLGTLHPAAELVSGAALERPGGRTWVSWSPSPGSWVQVRVPELDGRRFVRLAHHEGVLATVSSDADGTLRRHVVRLGTGAGHDSRDATCETADVEVVTLTTGVTALRSGATLELFHSAPGPADVRTLDVDLGVGPLATLDGVLLQLTPAGLDRLELHREPGSNG